MISVIVPIFRVDKYLDQCVESIVNQTYQNIEIILVDDGSDDNCPIICDNWRKKDPRARVIHKPNGGLSRARNVGIEFAHGDFITFVDGDDWIDERLFETSMKAIIENDADIAVCKAVSVYKDGQKEAASAPSLQYLCISDTSEKIKLTLSLPPYKDSAFSGGFAWKKLIKKEIMKNIRFIEDRSMCEDELFSLLIFKEAKRVAISPSSAYFYRIRSSSISRDQNFTFALLKSRLFMAEQALISLSDFVESNIQFLCGLMSFNLNKATKEEQLIYKESIRLFRKSFFNLYKLPVKIKQIAYTYFIITPFAPLELRQLTANLLYSFLIHPSKNKLSHEKFP